MPPLRCFWQQSWGSTFLGQQLPGGIFAWLLEAVMTIQRDGQGGDCMGVMGVWIKCSVAAASAKSFGNVTPCQCLIAAYGGWYAERRKSGSDRVQQACKYTFCCLL